MKENNKEGSLKLRMIKIKIKITSNFNILKSQLTILSKKLMVGAMAATFCGTNREIIIMKLMQSWLENMMKSKVMKKHNKLLV